MKPDHEEQFWQGYERVGAPLKQKLTMHPQSPILPSLILPLLPEPVDESCYWFRHLFDVEGNVL